MKMHWKTFDCTVDPSLVISFKCNIVEPERSLISAESNISRDLEQLNATFALYIFRETSNRYHKIIQMNLDVCEMYKNPIRNQIILAIFKSIMMNTNVTAKCPQLKVGKSIF